MENRRTRLVEYLRLVMEEIVTDMGNTDSDDYQNWISQTLVSSDQIKVITGLIHDILTMEDSQLSRINESMLSSMIYRISHDLKSNKHGA